MKHSLCGFSWETQTCWFNLTVIFEVGGVANQTSCFPSWSLMFVPLCWCSCSALLVVESEVLSVFSAKPRGSITVWFSFIQVFTFNLNPSCLRQLLENQQMYEQNKLSFLNYVMYLKKSSWHMFQLWVIIFITLCVISWGAVAPDHLKGLSSAVVRFITPSACRQQQISESFERFHSWMEDWTMIVVSVCVVDWLTEWEVNWSPDSTLVHWYSVVRCFY